MFPGIERLLAEGLSPGSAVATWRGMAKQYEDVAWRLGLLKEARLNRQNIGLLIRHNVKPEEFAFRLMVKDQARRTEGFRRAFNQVLRHRAEAELDKVGWARFLYGQAPRRLYDIYEATILLQELGPEGLKVREARRLGRALGQPGQPADLSEFTTVIGRIQAEVGTEQLRAAGIGAEELAIAALRDQLGSPDLRRRAEGVLRTVEQMLANRRAMEERGETQDVLIERTSGRPISPAAPQGELAG
jgi:hypothetical protein